MLSYAKRTGNETGASTPEAKRHKGTTSPQYSPPTSPRGDPITTVHPSASFFEDHNEDAAKKTSEGLADARKSAQLMLMKKDGPQIIKDTVVECSHFFLAFAAMKMVQKDGMQTVVEKLLDCLHDLLLVVIHEKMQHGAADTEFPTPDKIKELATAGIAWAPTMIERIHEKVDENLWMAMQAKLNGKVSAADLPEGTAIAACKLLPAYYALHILESSRVGSMSFQCLLAVKKLQTDFEMELGNAMTVECKTQLMYADIQKASTICKQTICEAIAEDV